MESLIILRVDGWAAKWSKDLGFSSNTSKISSLKFIITYPLVVFESSWDYCPAAVGWFFNNFFLDKVQPNSFMFKKSITIRSVDECAGHDFLSPSFRVSSRKGIHVFSDPLRCWLPICNWTSPSPAFRDATAEGLEMGGGELPLFVCQVGSVLHAQDLTFKDLV